MKMKISLRWKLTAAFLAVTAVVLALVGIFANVILEKQFKEYVIDKLEQNNQELISTLESRYQAWGNKWNPEGIENLGVSALGDGLMIRIYNQEGTLIWDAMTHNSGMCASILQHMSENMQGRNSNFNGGYIEKEYPVTVENASVGKVTIGYYGPYFYTDNDIQFLNSLNKLLLLATGVAGIISILIGTFMANRLTSPISRVIKNARQIAAGKFDDRIIENSNTREIVELTESINSLATTLGKQEVLRKRLTADVAHELRTPLSCVQSHLEAMIDGIWEPSKERLESCHEETVRLSKMVSDLGKLAQYDGENVTLKKEYFSLSELLSRLLKNFEKEFQKKRINLITSIQDQNIEADEDKLTQVLVNLFSNAIKYTPDGGTIEIETTGTKEYIEVSVKDTGIGIAEKDLPYIFERFYRVDQSRNRMTGGSGIGLAIAKSLVEAHNGTIEVKSEEGVGSEFIVRIPT